MRDQLEAKLSRFEELERALVDPMVLANQSRLSAVAREHGTLARLALKYRQFVALEREIAEHVEMAAGDDPDLKDLAKSELPSLRQRRERAQQRRDGPLVDQAARAGSHDRRGGRSARAACEHRHPR